MKKYELSKKEIMDIERYQCPGCVCGSDIECYEREDGFGIQCTKHVAGTTIMPGIGKVFLGLPSGFCRIGKADGMKVSIFKNMEYFKKEWVGYDKFNIPVWKFKDKHGNTLVRGISPRTNWPFLHVFLEDCIDKINCLEVSQDDVDGMD